MRKILFGLGLLALTFNSCSSDSESSDDNQSGDVLVKRVEYTSITDEYSENIEYIYNGNKLVKGVYDDGSEEIYTYDGDLITEIKFVDAGDVISTETFTYDSSDRLTHYVIDDSGFVDEEYFSYNGDGTVTGSADAAGLIPIRTYHFNNDQVIKIVGSGLTYNYTYDGKNSPFRNVTGFGKIAHVTHGDHEFYGSRENIATIYETTDEVNYMTNTMIYNSNNYPVSVESDAIFEDEPYTATVQYTYY